MDDHEARLKRIVMRSWRRGTREMDLILGPFSDGPLAELPPADVDAYEALLEEQDVDIMAWGLGTQAVPPEWQGEQMEAFRKLDFITLPEGLDRRA